MTSSDVLTISRYAQAHASRIRSELLAVYAEVYAREAARDPFFAVERFAQRLDRHSGHPGWACVLGTVGGETVGYAYGRPDSADDWTGLTDTTEDVRPYAHGTFGLCEIMVRTPWRGTGIARTLHSELMRDRPEQRASLLVEESHPKVRATYERWGYRTVGRLHPTPDAPHYQAMILPLRPLLP